MRRGFKKGDVLYLKCEAPVMLSPIPSQGYDRANHTFDLSTDRPCVVLGYVEQNLIEILIGTIKYVTGDGWLYHENSTGEK